MHQTKQQDQMVQYKAEVKILPASQMPYFDQLVHLFIRPPRQIYQTEQLGPQTFMYQKLLIHREDFTVQSSTGNKLQCSIYTAVRCKDQNRPCVIYLHGNSSSRMESINYAGLVCQEAMSLVSFDFGGCGISEGDYVSLGWFEKDDLLSVISTKLISFGIWGRSMGAVTAILAATGSKDIQYIVADSPYSCLKQVCIDIGEKQYHLPVFAIRLAFYMIRKKVRTLVKYDPKILDTMKYIKQLQQCSILFLRASDDQMIYQNQVEELYKVYKGEKFYTIFQGDHNTNRPPEIVQSIIRFFCNRLNPDKKVLQVKSIEEIKVKQQQFQTQLPSLADIKDKKPPNLIQNQEQKQISEKTDDQQIFQDLISLDINAEYASNEKINHTNRGELLNQDLLSKDSYNQCFDEQPVLLTPNRSQYQVNKQKNDSAPKKNDLVSLDSEGQNKIASESIFQNPLPQFHEGNY